MAKHKEEEAIKPFKIEDGVIPQKQGRVAIYPKEYFRIEATMALLEPKQSFLFPINGFKSSSVMGWVRKIEDKWANDILDLDLREKNKKVFHKSVIRDATKKDIGVRIFRLG